MKKLLFILIILGLIIPTTTIYAGPKANFKQNRPEAAADKNGNTKAIQAEIKLLQKQLQSNKQKLVEYKKQAVTSFNKAKNRLNILLKKKDSMTQDQLDRLSEAILSLQQDNKALEDASTELNTMYENLQNANSGTDYQLIKDITNEVINLQKVRITNLQQAINDMDRITKM